MQLIWLVKEVALTLNAHFPGRLAALWIVDPPPVLRWPLRALRKLLHPATAQKVQTCSVNDPALPLNLAHRSVSGTPPADADLDVQVETVPALQGSESEHFWYI